MPDAVDKAIAATAPKGHEMLNLNGQLATGKPFSISVPADMDALDGMALHHVITQAFDQVRAMQAQRQGALALPGGGLHLVKRAD
jgi:hypothetical protein